MNNRIEPVQVSRIVAICTLLFAGLTYACGGGADAPTQPAPPIDRTPIRVIDGADQVDTVDAVLPRPLLIEVRDTSGKLLPGATVQFQSVVALGGPSVSAANSVFFGSFVSDVTDAQGRARALVQMGGTAGSQKLKVTVPALRATDTVTVTVKPGAPATSTISPRDTSIRAGSSYTLKSQIADRYGNLITSLAPTFSGTGINVSAAGLITGGSTFSRGRILISYPGISDSAWVSVISRVPMLVNRNKTVVLVNSDGTGATTLATSAAISLSPNSVAASPNVVYNEGNASDSGKVWVVQPNSSPRLLLPGATRPEGSPRLSPDGAWVYFVRDTNSLWRVKLDGTGLDSLTSFTQANPYAAPTISPDGRSVAIEDGTGIQIYDVTARTSRTLPITCGFPAYSPDGAFFACSTPGSLSVVRTDGTGLRLVGYLDYTPSYLSGADWAPDGKWLVVTTFIGIQLIEVSTGTALTLRDLSADDYQASFVR